MGEVESKLIQVKQLKSRMSEEAAKNTTVFDMNAQIQGFHQKT